VREKGSVGLMQRTADIAIIGGSGFYSLFDSGDDLLIDTPYGPPSAPLVVADVAGRSVAFLPRHGRDHQFPPHRIPYRANLWALHALGVRQVLAPCAVGSLRPEAGPGAVVLPDQLLDRTSGRSATFHDGPVPAHVAFADPYCPSGRGAVLATCAAEGADAVDGGTLVVIDGPRFSTRAESRFYASSGCSLINMTAMPEAVLAREQAVCYTGVALVTDYDAGVDAATAVTWESVVSTFAANVARLRDLLVRVVPRLPATNDRDCPCARALEGIAVSR
jgi:5'-methylthioadenosine phosphorylase